MNQPSIEKKQNRIIIILSTVIPLAVAALFTIRIPGIDRLGFLPPIYASTNAITSLLLIFAVIQIKKGNRILHERAIKAAMMLSILFLLLYVAYHATADATKFGDANYDGIVDTTEKLAIGATAYLYYFLLLTHILLSIVVIPFALITYVRAINNKFEQHKKIAKYTFPLWLYVAASGVVVYLMISPYYPI